MDAQQQLFGLMAVAEEQQKAVNAAIDGLTAERAELAKERAAVAQAAASVAGVAVEIRKAVADAVGVSVKQSLAGASDAAAMALSEAVKPVIGSLSGVVQAASDAEGSLKKAGSWFAWKWVVVACGGLVGVCLVAYTSLAWQLNQVSSLREEKAALLSEIAQLQTQADKLAKLGGRAKLAECGKDEKAKTGRLCVRVDKSIKGYGEDSDYYILSGY
jgi:hypothetical protein